MTKFMTGIKYLDEIQYGGHRGSGHHLRFLQGRFGFGLHSRDLFAHYGCVNALEFSRDGEWLVSGGDDKRVLLWNVDRALSTKQCEPRAMKSEHNSNIFCLGFGGGSEGVVYSGGNDEQVIVHDARTGEARDVFFHDDAVYGLSVDPVASGVFASACDDGRVLVWDSRSRDPFVLAKATSAFHAVAHCPSEPRFLATANARNGICLWDVRRPRTSVLEYGPSGQSAMSVCFNASGTHLLALRRRSPPVLYRSTCTRPVAGFDHPAYYNSCTMKTCCFAGDRDQYVLSGSDDFKLYAWRVPPSDGTWVGRAHYVLRGHRSIVNQVRYNPALGLLASSGVEKIVKLWSPFPLASPDDKEVSSRRVYSHEEYINLVLEGGQVMNHDYSTQSTAEDQRMMAFFDSLVQRDIEGWTSDSNDGTEFLCPFVQPSESSSSSEEEEETSQQDTISTLIAHKRREQTRAKRTLARPSDHEQPPPKFLKTSVRSFRKRLTRVVRMSSSEEDSEDQGTSGTVSSTAPPCGEGRSSDEDESGGNVDNSTNPVASTSSVVSFSGKKRKGKNYRKRNDK